MLMFGCLMLHKKMHLSNKTELIDKRVKYTLSHFTE